VKVLVVDDEEDTREVIRRMLSQSGAEVMVASSAEEAMVMLKLEHPKVLVSDIGMPGKDGYELMREVRRSVEGARIGAVALTAFARSEDRTRAIRAGFQKHMAKPIEPHELLVTVGDLAGIVA
jgi:CheY-like chemotaxis protein